MKMTKTQWRRIVERASLLVNNGNVIDAIKLLRHETGCGLIDALKATSKLRQKTS